MKNFTKKELNHLIQIQDKCCISVFMPTHPTAANIDQDQIRFKNLMRRAEKTLQSMKLGKKDINSIFKKVESLFLDANFWRYQSDGLALFFSSNVFMIYRLPIKFRELFVAANRFHIKPLLPLFTGDGRFYVLALSQNKVRLMLCTRFSVDEIDLPDIPGGLQDTLGYDDTGKQLQFHTGTANGHGKRPAMFHGHGIHIDDAKDKILQYFRKIDRNVIDVLANENEPLILAGVDYLLPLYKTVNSYNNLLDEGILGNPENLRLQDLHQDAWKIVHPYFLKDQQDASARYRQNAESEFAINDLRKVVPAACFGRVEVLFVTVGKQRWGFFDQQKNEVIVCSQADAGCEDLLNMAAVETLMHGGTVFAMSPEGMPGESPIAALLRY